MGGQHLSRNSYDVGTPHKLFDVHNLLFGLVCFGAPLIICGVSVIAELSTFLDELPQLEYHRVVLCCSVTVGLYILVVLAIPISSFVTICYAYDTLAVLQDIGNDTIVEEVCNPLPLYSALVTSTALLGGIGVFLVCSFTHCIVAGVYYCIIEVLGC